MNLRNSEDLLMQLRKDLDDTDDRLLEILVKRFKIISMIGEHKKENNIPVIQNHRSEYIIGKARKVANNNNFNPEIFARIYQTIIDIACDMQEQIKD